MIIVHKQACITGLYNNNLLVDAEGGVLHEYTVYVQLNISLNMIKTVNM